MRALWDDVRFAFRRFRQQPAFTAVAVLTLALGLGANTAIFTLIHAVMLRSLPVTRPAELVRLGNTNDCCVNSGLPEEFSLFSYPLAQHLRLQLTEFSDLALFQANTTITGLRPPTGPPISAPASYVSGNYFRMLGVGPSAGRMLEPGDDVSGAPAVMVISHQLWVDRFASDPLVVGQSLFVNGTPVAVVGVAARGFFGETVRVNPAGVWLPLGQEPVLRGAAASLNGRPDQNWLYAIGRVAPGTDAGAISAHATLALRTWLSAQTFLPDTARPRVADTRITATSAAGGVQLMRGNFGQSLTLLFMMSGLVLLIAAANLANLLLARADRAQAAVRAALGASVSRLVRQSLAEGIVLALIGCAGAFLVSMFATNAIIAIAFPADAGVPVETTPSLTIVLFSVALSIVTGALFAAAPAWAMARTNPIEALRGLSREGADRSFMPRRSLVVVQVTLSLVLLAGAGLLTKSLSRLEHQPMGFEAADRVVVRIDPPPLSGEPDRLVAVYAAMQQKLQLVPGIVRASYSLYSPMEGNNWSSPVYIAGRPVDPERQESVSWNRIGPNYFDTMGTRVLRGRAIAASDTMTSERVVVVNDAFARRYLADSDPLSARLGQTDTAHSNDYAVVGVVEDVKYTSANLAVRPMVFFPVMQRADYTDPGMRQVQARSSLLRAVELQIAPGARNLEPLIRRALADAHPDLTVTRITPMTDQISGNFRNNRLLATLAGAYGVLALALASLGLYGVTAYGVSRRRHEIGVRMALGADRRRIVGGVMRGALVQTVIGLVVGVPLAMLATKSLTTQLFDVNARDPIVLIAAAAALLVTAGVAAALPARRAASVDPAKALRAQ